jgi:spore maturation protein CgeB
MKVYCVKYDAFAGKWIYDGYRSAWKELGYDVVDIDFPAGHNLDEDFMIMTTDSAIKNLTHIETLSKSKRSFIFVQPNSFPKPWGTHPNFISTADNQIIDELNNLSNVYYWTFVDVDKKYYHKWKRPIYTIPLAFDSINYKPTEDNKYNKYDISFVGGWADNGFDEKKKIIIDVFSKFMNSGLKCGFFINKNLSHYQECQLLANSKMTLNIHDAYQRTLGLDTNERTFKSLGLNGLMVSDTVGQLNNLFPEIFTSLNSDELVKHTKFILSLTDGEKHVIKEENKQNILENHCYLNRVKTLLNL